MRRLVVRRLSVVGDVRKVLRRCLRRRIRLVLLCVVRMILVNPRGVMAAFANEPGYSHCKVKHRDSGLPSKIYCNKHSGRKLSCHKSIDIAPYWTGALRRCNTYLVTRLGCTDLNEHRLSE